MYRIRDKQFECRYFGGDEGILFVSKEEILEQLSLYHDLDYTGVKDNDEPYRDIYQFLTTLQNDEERLAWLLEYGEWEITKE